MAPAVSPSLQTGYDEQYDESMTAWRELGGKYKAERIVELSRGLGAKRVLDCGCGEGSVLKFLAASGRFDELHGVDISDSGVAQTKKRELPRVAEVKKFDGYEVPYPDGFFDLSYATHVVEHVEHPRLLLRELARVSKRQILEVPLDYHLRCDRDVGGQLAIGHINVYSPSTFRFLVRSEGFTILDEQLSQLTADVWRHAWYERERLPRGLRRNWRRELKLALTPLRNRWERWRKGPALHDELGFDALTVLTRHDGALEIM
jgi:SAM-dependent methyltransferase